MFDFAAMTAMIATPNRTTHRRFPLIQLSPPHSSSYSFALKKTEGICDLFNEDVTTDWRDAIGQRTASTIYLSAIPQKSHKYINSTKLRVNEEAGIFALILFSRFYGIGASHAGFSTIEFGNLLAN